MSKNFAVSFVANFVGFDKGWRHAGLRVVEGRGMTATTFEDADRVKEKIMEPERRVAADRA